MKPKTVRLPKEVFEQLEKERNTHDPAPTLHAWMLFKLKKPIEKK